MVNWWSNCINLIPRTKRKKTPKKANLGNLELSNQIWQSWATLNQRLRLFIVEWRVVHYQKFAKYQRIYRKNIFVGNLRSKLPTDTFPSVIQSVTTDGKVSELKKKASRWRGGFGGLFVFRRNHRRIQNDSPYSAHTVTWPVRRLNCRRTHRGIWNGRSVRWRVYVSVRITDGFTDGIAVGETVGKS